MSSQVPSEPDPNNSNIISVLFKLPNGLRIERRFRNTDTLTVSFSLISMLGVRHIMIPQAL